MALVIGVDFGTLSIRASVVDSKNGLLESAVAEYPLHRKREDPEFATQSHADHMRALASATREALRKAGVSGNQIEAIALDTTGSSVVPVGKDLQPLDDYYLWCDHRAKGEAAEITEAAHREGLEAIQWCGGVYSSARKKNSSLGSWLGMAHLLLPGIELANRHWNKGQGSFVPDPPEYGARRHSIECGCRPVQSKRAE